MAQPRILLGVLAAALVLSGTARAQVETASGPGLVSINSGNVSADGSIYNPVINGGSQNTISITAQGAVVSAKATPGFGDLIGSGGSASLSYSVSGSSMTSSNSGSVTVSGAYPGGTSQSGANGSLSVTASGVSSSISIAQPCQC